MHRLSQVGWSDVFHTNQIGDGAARLLQHHISRSAGKEKASSISGDGPFILSGAGIDLQFTPVIHDRRFSTTLLLHDLFLDGLESH